MNITEIRNKTAAAQASKAHVRAKEFINSPLKDFIDKQIEELAGEGKNELWLNFDYTTERVLGERYGEPLISSVIHYYQNKGFTAWDELWRSPDGSEHVIIIISWKY